MTTQCFNGHEHANRQESKKCETRAILGPLAGIFRSPDETPVIRLQVNDDMLGVRERQVIEAAEIASNAYAARFDEPLKVESVMEDLRVAIDNLRSVRK